MSRTMLGAGDFGRLAIAIALAACGGSSELGLFGSGGAGSGGSPLDASEDRAAGGAGGSTGGAGGADMHDAAQYDASAERGAAEDGGIDVTADRDMAPDRNMSPDRDASPADTGSSRDASIDRDAALDAIVVVDACRPTNGGVERCDGIDNDCDGRIDDRNACPAGCIGRAHAGHGYMLCYAPMARRAWQAAENACEQAGMHLVRVDDAAENAFIRATAAGVNDSSAIWIGGSDLATERRWVWTDGTPFWMGGPGGMPIGNAYSNWDVGEPNDGNRNVDCAGMRDGGETWRDANCALRRAYFCEE
jgi:hypothetical protein